MSSEPARHDVSIRRWTETADKERWVPALDHIFFEASASKTFASTAERAAFRERWLGRYLTYAPGWAYLAIDPEGVLAGYLVGNVEDKAKAPRLSGIDAFEGAGGLAARYPAHLHVNLAPQYRNHGIGAELITAFAADAARAGARGMHVITAAGARNVGFYERNDFRELARAGRNDREIVLLGRELEAPDTT